MGGMKILILGGTAFLGRAVAPTQRRVSTRARPGWGRSLLLWLGDRNERARFDSSAAARRPHCRPLVETLLGALDDEEERPGPRPQGAGLSNDDERELLTARASR